MAIQPYCVHVNAHAASKMSGMMVDTTAALYCSWSVVNMDYSSLYEQLITQ